MPYIETITAEKARRINNTPSIYGTFAEIGAGQEVVNHFFKVGQASQTVAKSMSAYDMVFSDEIYGRAGRYVSEERLLKMLDHEHTLLQKRLKAKRGSNTLFFAFADTVAASTLEREVVGRAISQHHGWMGIRFQNTVAAATNDIIIHVNLLDKTRLQQYETLGILGVNLIYSAFYVEKKPRQVITSLFDNFEPNRVDIDVLRCDGKIFKQLDKQELNLELIRQNLTQALLFQQDGTNVLPADALYEKPILVVGEDLTTTHTWQQVDSSIQYVKNHHKISSPVLLMNVPVQSLKDKTIAYFLKQYKPDLKKIKNWYMLVSHFNHLYALKEFIQTMSKQPIFILLSSQSFKQLFSSKSKEEDALAMLGRLCNSNVTLLVNKTSNRSFKLQKELHYLEQYLLSAGHLVYLN